LGVAHGCKILPVKIWGADDLAPSADVAETIRYAGMHADVLSCSWSCTPDADIHQALIDVKLNGRDGKGCPVFCATGNNWRTPVTPVSYPARYYEAIAVGASTNLGVRADYSQYGEDIDFVAPGSGGTMAIFTTDVSIKNRGLNIGQDNAGDPEGLYTNNFGGTSAATAIAAGVAALILSVNPNLTSEQVRQIKPPSGSPPQGGRTTFHRREN
jgi:subtilisin family serine protease